MTLPEVYQLVSVILRGGDLSRPMPPTVALDAFLAHAGAQGDLDAVRELAADEGAIEGSTIAAVLGAHLRRVDAGFRAMRGEQPAADAVRSVWRDGPHGDQVAVVSVVEFWLNVRGANILTSVVTSEAVH